MGAGASKHKQAPRRAGFTDTGASAAEQECGQNTLGGNNSTGQIIKETDKVSAMLASKTDKKSQPSSSESETRTTMPALETDSTSSMSALQKVYQVLVDCLDPDPVLDKLLEIGFHQTTIRDIREERLTSDRNRKLIEAVRKRGYKAYCNFKLSLVQCRQELLFTLLERTEKGENTLDLQREIREKTREKTKPETKDEQLYKGLTPRRTSGMYRNTANSVVSTFVRHL